MTLPDISRAARVIARCREIAQCTETPGETTRRFLSPPMHEVHTLLRGWMEDAGMSVRVDAAGNLRGLYVGVEAASPCLVIGSHLDTVPDAGAFDGVLGVVLGVALVEELRGRRLPYAIEVIGFSEEEGVRFSKPFLGSLAVAGRLDAETRALTDQHGISVGKALHSFGLGGLAMSDALLSKETFAYLEFHIEQGPVLESQGKSLGIVDTIAGQTRMQFTFTGQANHAGTTPMGLRRDALAVAAYWMVEVEQYACSHAGLVATVGRIEAKPGAGNVIPGEVTASLDVRHASDTARHLAVASMLQHAQFAATSRGVIVAATTSMDQAAVAMDKHLVALLQRAAMDAGFPAEAMSSGAGHDAMILADYMPSVMLFLRSPGGLSHHPDESVLPEDVEAAVATGLEFLFQLRVADGRVSSEMRKGHA